MNKLIVTTGFLLSFLFAANLSAQIYLQPTIYSPTVGNSDGAIKVELIGYNGPVDYVSYVGGAPVYSDSIGGLAYDQGVTYSAFEAGTSNLLATISCFSLGNRMSKFEYVNVINPSGNLLCDGSVSAIHEYDLQQYSEADFSRDICIGGFNSNGTPTTGFFEWGSLCEEDYGVLIRDLNTYDTILFSTLKLNSLNNGTSSTTVNIYSTVSDTANCTSNSFAFVNGTGPFQYSYDYSVFTSSGIKNNMCPGMHVLQVIDGFGDTVGVNFGVVDSMYYFQGPFWPNFVDTISVALQNCNFNYSMPVDSFNIIYYEAIDSSTIYFESEIWQGNNVIQVGDTVSTATVPTGLCSLVLTLYCGTKAVNNKIYQLEQVLEFELGLSVIDDHEAVAILPNPSSGIFKIDADNFEEVVIFDTYGKVVLRSERREIDLSTNDSGVYFCRIQLDSESFVTRRIIKQ